MQLVMLRSGSEVPEDGIVILRKQGEAIGLVLRPCAYVRCGEITHVVHVEAQERSDLGLSEQVLGALQTLTAQAIEVDTIFPINRHRSVCRQCHGLAPES